MSKFRKLLGSAAVVATLSLAATSAEATAYVTGSFAFDAPSTTTTSVTSTIQFAIANILTGSPTPTGDFVGQSFPGTLSSPGTIDFTTPGTALTLAAFDWSDPGLGSFTASSVQLITTVSVSGFASVTYGVLGTFDVGADWSNSGTNLSGSETWTCNQTNGPGNAVRCGGTFNAPASVTVPEPLTVSLFGIGLAGAAAFGRRRKNRATA